MQPEQQPTGFMGLLGALQNGITSPLFQSGAAMYSAASQGKDIGTGFLMGGEAAGKAARSQLEQSKVQRELLQQQQRDQLWQSLISGQTPAWATGLPAGTLELARALGPDAGATLITQMMAKNSERGIERDKLNETIRYNDIRAKQADAQLLEAQNMNAERQVLMRGQAEMTQQKLDEARAREVRRRELFGTTPPPAAPAQPDPYLQPQSFEGDAPDLIQTQAAGPPPAPAADPRKQGLIQTPRGWMSPAMAQDLAQKLLVDPEYRSLGQSILKDIERSKETSGLDKGAKAEVEKGMVSNVNLVGRLNAISEGFSKDEIGEFLTWKGRGAQVINSMVEKAGGTLKEEDQTKLQRYAQFRSATSRNLNTLLKELSGAAVTQQEFERLVMAEPNAGTGGWADFISGFDSPTQFMAKLNSSRSGAMLAIARANYLRQKDGLGTAELSRLAKAGTLEEIISLDGMKNVMNQQQIMFENQLRQEMRGADENDIRNAVRGRMKQTFGI